MAATSTLRYLAMDLEHSGDDFKTKASVQTSHVGVSSVRHVQALVGLKTPSLAGRAATTGALAPNRGATPRTRANAPTGKAEALHHVTVKRYGQAPVLGWVRITQHPISIPAATSSIPTPAHDERDKHASSLGDYRNQG